MWQKNKRGFCIENFFHLILHYPKRLLLLASLLMVVIGGFLPALTNDLRPDAFLADDNPALIYRDKVKEMFGLSDPMVIAIVSQTEDGIYTPATLSLIDWLTHQIEEVANVNPERIISLATEKNIKGTMDGMEVTPFFDPFPQTQLEADKIRKAIEQFPLYHGSLVSRDGKATVIVAELLDEDNGEETYDAFIGITQAAKKLDGISLHVAGDGAITGYMGTYIFEDAVVLNPLAGLVIFLIIVFAFRRLQPAFMINGIIAATLIITFGVMAATKTPFYIITNGLPVILIGICVADAIHIFSHYFELQTENPSFTARELVQKTMVDIWRPITLTTLTTIAGFLGLSLGAYMPPFRYFGYFAALGVSVAWLYSIIFLPPLMVVLKPQVAPKFIRLREEKNSDFFTFLLIKLGNITQSNPRLLLIIGGIILAISSFMSFGLQVDEDNIETFHPSEKIYQADREINRHMDGSKFLNIVIETKEKEGLLEPSNLHKIDTLQKFVLTLPHVSSATSIVDYLKQINRSLNNGAAEQYTLPENSDMAAQYFLIYSASSDPTDFEEEVDYDYQIANIRVTLNNGSYSNSVEVIEPLEAYLDTHFNTTEITASLSGRVNLNYHWIKNLGKSHFQSVIIALLLVWLVSALLFRSVLGGLFALLPVLFAIVLIYSGMVILGITLGIGSSMFASVAIGLGVDYSIHVIDRIKAFMKHSNDDLATAISQFYPRTGRALLFNFLAISGGFGMLMISKVVPVNLFGTIVVLAITTSFFASMTILPALLTVFRPRFIFSNSPARVKDISSLKTGMILLVFLSILFFSFRSFAEDLPEASWIVEQINMKPDGQQVTRKLTMTMIDRRGKKRVRETLGYRKYFGKERRSIIFYLSPRNVKNTGFLTFDYPATDRDDDQWLYLPALRKVRRISASDRGDYFLGTDLTYEDVKQEGKIDTNDYTFETLAEEVVNGHETFHVKCIPQDSSIAKELGYSRNDFWVDKKNWVIVKSEYWDVKNNPLKGLQAEDIRLIDDIWTRHKLIVENYKTGHKTIFLFKDVDYKKEVKDRIFTKHALERGGH